MNNLRLLKKLAEIDQPYFTTTDMGKVLDVGKQSLSVTLNRLVKNGVLIRLKKGIYQPEFQRENLTKVANQLYYPSYLSFESALSKYGILSQTPYTITFATSKPSKKLKLKEKEIEYKQLKKEYFFGYVLKDNVYIAEAEKAILDQLYMISRGVSAGNPLEWSFVDLDRNKLTRYSKKFPIIIQKQIKELTSRFGLQTTSVK